MKIPLVEDNNSFDVTTRPYLKALYNTLIELKPKYCLEIGTFEYRSAQVFAHYFEKFNPGGLLITADISEWKRSPVAPPRVHPVMVYPHHYGVLNNHGGIKVYHPMWEKATFGGASVGLNGMIINEKMAELGIDNFDLAFIDGDHQRESIESDFHIVLPLMRKHGHLVLDDIHDRNHPDVIQYYKANLKDKYKCYDYEDWNVNPGMALIEL